MLNFNQLPLKNVNLDQLYPFQNRSVDAGNLRLLTKSVKEYGVIQPILVCQARVIDGWCRVEAARFAGLKTIPSRILAPETCIAQLMEIRNELDSSESQTSLYGNLENCCQLYEEIRIIYVVDGYVAQLFTENGDSPEVAGGKGETIAIALWNLNRVLEGWNLDRVRKTKFGTKPSGIIFDDPFNTNQDSLPSVQDIAKDSSAFIKYAKEQAHSIMKLPKGTKKLFGHYQHPGLKEMFGCLDPTGIRDRWMAQVDIQINLIKRNQS